MIVCVYGFMFVEFMIILVIVVILVMIVYFSYMDYIMCGKLVNVINMFVGICV